jgi:hypothetical protein
MLKKSKMKQKSFKNAIFSMFFAFLNQNFYVNSQPLKSICFVTKLSN